MKKKEREFTLDLVIILLSILLALFMVKVGFVSEIISSSKNTVITMSFVAGMFFTSVFTTVPAVIALVEIARIESVWITAFFGAMGAVVGDTIIFIFARKRLSLDFFYLMKKTRAERAKWIVKSKLFRIVSIFLGGLIIASPLPDELGLMMMGLTKLRTSFFMALSYSFNFLGILAIGGVARVI
ncbi:hypothetical protein HYV50_04315 [Candidatus Pacearchaeota archaeon]|nr:hypothetical protein [Candidatus Pacearchaeota archaeon]